jgi:hypothetical protein
MWLSKRRRRDHDGDGNSGTKGVPKLMKNKKTGAQMLSALAENNRLDDQKSIKNPDRCRKSPERNPLRPRNIAL